VVQDASRGFPVGDERHHPHSRAATGTTQNWFHRQLDQQVSTWVKDNPAATQQEFENYLREVYQRPEVLDRFPDGLKQ
jgi:hypothetical protein